VGMANTKAKKIKRKIKKELSIFLKDESGLMSRENIIKIGVGTISAFSLLASSARADDVSQTQDTGEAAMVKPPGTTNQMTHTNSDVIKWSGGSADGSTPKLLYPSHVHHTVHESY